MIECAEPGCKKESQCGCCFKCQKHHNEEVGDEPSDSRGLAK